MKISLALHLVGLVMWLGSLLIITRCFKIFTREYPKEASDGLNSFRTTLRKIYFGFSHPGMGIALLTGIYQISSVGFDYYMKLGWFHSKLTLVVILFILTILTGKEIKKITKGEVISAKRAGALHIGTTVCMIAIIFLTILNR